MSKKSPVDEILFGKKTPPTTAIALTQPNMPEHVEAEILTEEIQPANKTQVIAMKSQTGGGDRKEIPIHKNACKEIEFGEIVPRNPVERYKATAGVVDRIAIVSKKLIQVKYHFVDGERKKIFFCFEGDCCADHGLPAIRYVFPMVQYDISKKGEVISDELTFKFLALSNDPYVSLITLNRTAPLDQVDLVVNCTDTTFQKNSFTYAGKATWHAQKEKVVQMYQRLWPLVPSCVASPMNAENYEKFMKAAGEASFNPSEFDGQEDISSFLKTK